jgi:hypothetical protein
MSDESNSVDARIVKTIRELKNNPSSHNSRETKEESDNKDGNMYKSSEDEKVNRNQFVKHKSFVEKIYIEDKDIRPIDQSQTKLMNILRTNNRYNTVKDQIKGALNTNSHYRQKLMSEKYLEKYRQTCSELIKNNTEIKTQIEKYTYDKNYFEFLNKHLFSDHYFLYKLEHFLCSSHLISKQQKEKYFLNEIQSLLSNLKTEDSINNTLNLIQSQIKLHIENINNFNF